MRAYHELERIFARDARIQDVLGLLQWDSDTMLPKGASSARAEQLATLKRIARDLLVCGNTADLLDEADAASDHAGDWQRANLREMRRSYAQASAVPADLTEASSKAVSEAEKGWQEARKNNDFKSFAPELMEVLNLQRQIGQAKGDMLGVGPYDALLDSYDPGLTEKKVEALFAPVRQALPGLIEQAREHQENLPDPEALSGPFCVDVQKDLARKLVQAVGFDFKHGRLDISAHPFSGGANGDVRIAARYSDGDFLGSISGVLHESGHALYEQGRPKEWLHQPVGAPRAMSIHESQALIIEMQACRTRAFACHLGQSAREAFGGQGTAWHGDNIYRLTTKVEPSLIRVDADEVTYPAHILLRYDLEKAMVAGDLSVEDLPGAFNDSVKKWLGITVPDDARGCLQDVHWAGGSWGYFPTYTIGAMTAAQLFQAACRADSDTVPDLARGEFGRLLNWLRTNLHSKGSLLQIDDLITAATGRSLQGQGLLDHLRARYVEKGDR
jgi:carboxypeptidase Taq